MSVRGVLRALIGYGPEWDEVPCTCGHDLYRHRMETLRGACDVIGCPCRRFEKGDAR